MNATEQFKEAIAAALAQFTDDALQFSPNTAMVLLVTRVHEAQAALEGAVLS